jgi:hypothetical protein
MAAVQDAESARELALRIPESVLADMSPSELNVRIRYVLDLQAKADANPDRGASLRRRAGKALAAMSPSAYADRLSGLEAALADAHRRGADHEARAALAEIEQLKRAEPQPEPRWYLEAGLAAASRAMDQRLKIPPPENKSAFTRRFGSTRKRGRR